MPISHDLGDDGQSNFFRTDCADVESDGRSNLPQLFLTRARFTEPVDHDGRTTLTANQSDVIWFRLEHRAHALFVFTVPARHDRN